jgi:hypothetical protein
VTTVPGSSPGSVEPSDLTGGDVAAITSAFAAFFGGSTSTVDEKVALLEHGESYRSMLSDAAANAQFQKMSTEIRSVRAGTAVECSALEALPGCAVVTHDLLVGGFPMAASIDSPAVKVSGKWLVGARAWCKIVEMGGETCPPVAG